MAWHARNSRETEHKTKYYEEYTEYAKTLRTWLIAYGIAGPVLYMTQKNIPAGLVSSARWIAIVFLVGVALQALSECVSLQKLHLVPSLRD